MPDTTEERIERLMKPASRRGRRALEIYYHGSGWSVPWEVVYRPDGRQGQGVYGQAPQRGHLSDALDDIEAQLKEDG